MDACFTEAIVLHKSQITTRELIFFLITGATNGIGKETARVLALRHVHVVMGVRNVIAGEKLREELLQKISYARIEVMEIDLNSLDSVRKFASQYISRGLPLNILINNAGILAPFKFTLSKDNIEQTFAVNHLGQFLLTNLLLETMKKTARKNQTEGRIINLSSFMHRYGVHKEGIRFEEIKDEKSYSSSALGRSAYGLSKLCNILHTNELARRFKEEGVNITANSLHPGFITTNIFAPNAGVTSWMMNTLAKFISKDIGQGASTTCYLALNPKVKGVSGQYFVDNNKVEASKLVRDSDLAKKLWNYSLSFTEAKY
ncbi:Short-chain dehydrogenase TIC 32, chloroplastic [Heracleum sosnowskyi]|uniref:Short-chain dehydrogenase TIC 32, chloroplastic n=1 Tax=Heracleum sosnowskyi TaxID=360622 RepID=A0AAD8HE71_9APIA|nr:Short-chain dehydrogenase TIC 32, chloroplastic [Heracleum sosnowskyi]